MCSGSPARTGWLKIFVWDLSRCETKLAPRLLLRPALLELCHFYQRPLSSALRKDCKWRNHSVYFLLLWGLDEGWMGEGGPAGGARSGPRDIAKPVHKLGLEGYRWRGSREEEVLEVSSLAFCNCQKKALPNAPHQEILPATFSPPSEGILI